MLDSFTVTRLFCIHIFMVTARSNTLINWSLNTLKWYRVVVCSFCWEREIKPLVVFHTKKPVAQPDTKARSLTACLPVWNEHLKILHCVNDNQHSGFASLSEWFQMKPFHSNNTACLINKEMLCLPTFLLSLCPLNLVRSNTNFSQINTSRLGNEVSPSVRATYTISAKCSTKYFNDHSLRIGNNQAFHYCWL